MNMRNLILIHLESLNYMNYHLNQHMFPNLSKWEKKSLSFHNYFSTATSTWMVIADLLYGGMLQHEACRSLGDIPEKFCYDESLLDHLKKQGYETKTLIYENGGGDYEKIDGRHIVGFQNTMELVQGYPNYMEKIERTVKTGRPFALLLCNFLSSVTFNRCIPNLKSKSGLDRFETGFEFIDTWTNDIMKLLERENVIENTIVVFYGDHGDDYYGHGGHGGLTHALEPYANLIRTPFWIYDGRIPDKTYDCLIDSTDIKTLVEALLETQKGNQEEGLDIPFKKYSLARNSYAAQSVRNGSFNKGYSLTDGRFLFLVSNLGMEMYDIRIDMPCQNNLLNYFTYQDGILHMDERKTSLAYHFTSLMDMCSFRQIRQKLYSLRQKTYDEVQVLFRYAECEEEMRVLKFEEIHYL